MSQFEHRVGDVERLDIAGLGELLRERRGRLSLRQAAADAGVSFSTFGRVESGSQPDLVTFTKLCAWLGLPPSRFFTPVVERKVPPLEAAIAHLKGDPALSEAASASIGTVMRQLYSRLAEGVEAGDDLVACHLRASAVLRPGVAPRLGDVLKAMHDALHERVMASDR
ncbi:MAG TPA: helix-turn-helix transcriptional regulator [Polyangiaceae bacterium]|nr:helix-turn-helix transcriptional regulator [Polyangiaceae bacterium]